VVRIEQATVASEELVEAFARLIPQLSSSAAPPTRDELEAVISSPATTLLLALDDDDRINGSLTLALFRIPTGLRAWIEDVVVDAAARAQGVGQALVDEALRIASTAGARTVDLTSRPSRDAANRLYEKTGFQERQTNVYRHELS
jgi:ribosomal protein S18 acetylase RimI-like enzyme